MLKTLQSALFPSCELLNLPLHAINLGVGVIQVVHLYQELRKLMGDDFMVKDLNSQDPSCSMLRGMLPYQALTPADEQARQRRLAQDPTALQVLHPAFHL